MNPILKNILAVIIGVITFMTVNGSIDFLGKYLIPFPSEADFSTIEAWNASANLLLPKHYLVPFLAHALGTFAGAFVAAYLAFNHKMKFAYGIGLLGLIGGIMAVYLIIAPLWFEVLDLILAYIPMACLAGNLAIKKSN